MKGRRPSNTYYERTTTVHFILPSTGEKMCTKLNRVQRTQCRPENDARLCQNFLDGHCDNGNGCPNVHVPRQYLWVKINPQLTPDHLYEPGFEIRCYTADMSAYYRIPSEYIIRTQGSDRYVELFNENGDNFKEKCMLCPTLMSKGCCEIGEKCELVHCCLPDISKLPCIITHIAEAERVKQYEHLPTNVVVRVFQPNTGDGSEDYPGNDVLRTVGATQYEEAFNNEGGIPSSMKMQHCAHFQSKKLCRLGKGCRFLHVVSLALRTPAQMDDDDQPRSPDSVPYVSPLSIGDPIALNPRQSVAQRNMAANAAVQSMLSKAVPLTINTGYPYAAATAAPPADMQAAMQAGNPRGGSGTFASPTIVPASSGYASTTTTSGAAGTGHGRPSSRISPLRRNDPYSNTGSMYMP